MNCAEFEAVLPDILEGGAPPNSETHLSFAPACSESGVRHENYFASGRLLRASRRAQPEGLELHRNCFAAGGPDSRARRGTGVGCAGSLRHWTVSLVVARRRAAFLVTFGILRYERPVTPSPQMARTSPPAAPAVITLPAVGTARRRVRRCENDDKQMLEVVGTRSPGHAGLLRNGAASM